MSARAIDPPVNVAVAPTPTTMATFDTTSTQVLAVQVGNTDAAQTLSCTVQCRAVKSTSFVDTTLGDLMDIGPLTSVCVNIDCGANAEIRILGTASGAGLTATIAGRDKPRVRS